MNRRNSKTVSAECPSNGYDTERGRRFNFCKMSDRGETVESRVHTYIHTYTHTYTPIYTYIHKYTIMYTHIYTLTYHDSHIRTHSYVHV